ncbi:recombinase family protein [Jiangella sp. DSM 45060]|uniref:recombinase family protein n=1 Tax=Jiangella sp. DSM 45060 TaxID=1798224 RepID=UPI0008794893|nr:recombinase family protein [Jiangella sp. DSM 45060]SDT35871.1 Site-specific DNA recombinase [Jiangella sp. DSM 45060]
MKLVACLRVSSNGQLDAYGPDAQRADIKGWAKANGHKVISWHQDAISGATDAVDRPGLSAALQDLERADGLIVANLGRLARAVTTQEAILAAVWCRGYRVFTADQGEVMQDDPSDPMRTAMRLMVGVFAELDRLMVVKRLKDGRAAKAAAGKKATGSYAFGYKGHGKGRDRDEVPDPVEQVTKARIVELRQAGTSYRTIAATLDQEGRKPRRAKRWSAMTVRTIYERATA